MSYRNLAYYRGDPGFFAGLSKFAKKAGRVVGKVGKFGKFLPGVGTAVSLIEAGGSVGRALAGGPLRNIGLPRGIQVMPGAGVVGPPVMSRIGGPVVRTRGTWDDVRSGGGSTAPRRRYRRMNYTNFRALKRSMRRVKGFAEMAKSAITFTQRVKMKAPRRKK